MDRQTTFLLALGLLIVAALSVGVSGWVLFARDHALVKAGGPQAAAPKSDANHREGVEGA